MSEASLSAEDEAVLAGVPRGRTESPSCRSDCADCGEILDSVEREIDRDICYACYCLQQDRALGLK